MKLQLNFVTIRPQTAFEQRQIIRVLVSPKNSKEGKSFLTIEPPHCVIVGNINEKLRNRQRNIATQVHIGDVHLCYLSLLSKRENV